VRERPRRGESAESRAFRECLEFEDDLEDALGQAISALRKAGYSLEVLDITALCRLARPVAIVVVDGERTPVIEPIGTWASAYAFDQEMFAAGLRRYIRRPLGGDNIPPGAPDVVLVC
jgi:hypothetical protein